MLKHTAIVTVLLSALSGTAVAQQCLHEANETSEQAARRREALTATRMVNNLEANQAGNASRSYLRQVELGLSPFATRMRDSTDEVVRRISLNTFEEILPKWKLTLDVTPDGYWFMIADVSDPCGFAYISNQNGVIFSSAPIR